MTTSAPIRCVLYLRVSLDATGERLAVERHRKDCQRLADLRGWVIVGEYVDNSITASDPGTRRPEYDRMVEAYAAGAFEAVICWDLDRLTRQPRQLEDWVEAAETRGLLLVTANGEADLSTDGGRMYARIKIAVARAEIERKTARRKSANAQRAQKGLPMSGARLTGYRTTDGVTEVVEAEAEYVREMFKRFAAGDSVRGIATWLNENEAATTRFGNSWNPTSVTGILKNPRYAGRAVYQGQVVPTPGRWEALVDAETFDVVQARLADPRRRTQVGTDRKHLGSGLYVCGVCEARVSAFTGGRYRCRQAHVNRTQTVIDPYVLGVMRARLARPDLAELLPGRDDGQARALTGELVRLRKRLETIEEDYDAERIDGRRYAVATEKVKAELVATEAALGQASPGRGTALLHAADPVAAFDAAPLMLQRAALESLMTVRLLPAPRGRKTFDPATVVIDWR